MFIFLIIYIHVVACLLWVTFSLEKTWIPAVDFIYAKTSLFEDQFIFQYLSMAYHSIMVFGLNEVAPRTSTEIFVIILIMIISAMINAFIFGEMAFLVHEMERKNFEFQEIMDTANTIMHSLSIPKSIQDNVREYLLSVNVAKTQQSELKESMESISPSLRKDM